MKKNQSAWRLVSILTTDLLWVIIFIIATSPRWFLNLIRWSSGKVDLKSPFDFVGLENWYRILPVATLLLLPSFNALLYFWDYSNNNQQAPPRSFRSIVFICIGMVLAVLGIVFVSGGGGSDSTIGIMNIGYASTVLGVAFIKFSQSYHQLCVKVFNFDMLKNVKRQGGI